jgi:hypothetical protein
MLGAEVGGRCQVEQIHRQIPDDYRAAVRQMAAGNVRQGLEGLERMNWIRQGQSDYLEKAAADFLHLTDQGRNLDRCLAVSFTWEENHRFTESIRKGLKERGVLHAEGTRLEVHEPLRWTNQQKRNWQRYEPGQVVTFAPERDRPAPCATVVRVERKKVVVALASRKEILLDFRRPDSFDVARSREIEVSPGDKILIRANDKRLGLTNGQLLTISSIAADGALQTKDGLCVPADFKQWCHGYVLTSHKAQGLTVDHVVVAAERLTSKGAYVACSRGRRSCIIHTPNKARLIERLPEGDRRAALDVFSEIRPKSASIVNRVRAWKQLSIELAQRLAAQLTKSTIDRPDANCVPAKTSEAKECPPRSTALAYQLTTAIRDSRIITTLERAVISELYRFFRPELIGRFDEKIVFKPLPPEVQREIGRTASAEEVARSARAVLISPSRTKPSSFSSGEEPNRRLVHAL